MILARAAPDAAYNARSSSHSKLASLMFNQRRRPFYLEPIASAG